MDQQNANNGGGARRLPAVVSDIDGVVYAGGVICGNSQQVISDILLKKHGKTPGQEGVALPLVMLTNGGMQTETDKVASMNKKLKLDQY